MAAFSDSKTSHPCVGLSQVTVVIPARNEADHLPGLFADLQRELLECPVVVVDNGSHDATQQVAEEMGAKALVEIREGKGAAVRAALHVVSTDYVFLCDADIRGLRRESVAALFEVVCANQAPAARMAIQRPPQSAPVTLLTARPILAALGYAPIMEPLGGLFLTRTQWLRDQQFPDGWAFDVALTLAAARSGNYVAEVVTEGITHRHKDLAAYGPMALEIAAFLVQSHAR